LSFYEARTRSLKTYLSVGLVGLFLAGFGLSYGLRAYVMAQVEAQNEVQLQALGRVRAQQELQRVNLVASFQLRAFLGFGDQRALREAQEAVRVQPEALRSFLDCLSPEDLAELDLPVRRLQGAIDAWRRDLWDPLTLQGGRPSQVRRWLDLEREHFEMLQEEMDRLVRALDARDDARLVRVDQALWRSRWIALGGMAIVLVMALVWMRWFLGRVADPLRDLAETARGGEGFLEEPEAHPVREVDILRKALYALSHRVQEREEHLREGQVQAQALHGFGELVQRLDREEDLLGALDQALRRLLEPEDLRIALRPSDDMGRMVCRVPSDRTEDRDHRVLRQPMDCRAIQRGQGVVLATKDPLACRCTFGLPEQGAYACFPLVASGEALGVVNLRYRSRAQLTTARVRLAEGLVASAAQGLQLLRALATARDQALRDGLTGAYNRRFLDEVLPKELNQARRTGKPLAVLMLDIDHFKRFNDLYGHDVGDRVLGLFARTLQAGLRAGDFVARYGGEEFTVVLPGAGLDEGQALAERLRQTLEGLELPVSDFPAGARITASVGVSAFPTHGSDAESLLHAADRGLYLAKGTGRNRVVVAPLDTP